MKKNTNKREKEIIELVKLKEMDYDTFLQIKSFIKGVLFAKGINTYE